MWSPRQGDNTGAGPALFMKRFNCLALLALAWILAAPAGGQGHRALAVGTGSGQMVLVSTERQLPISGDPIW